MKAIRPYCLFLFSLLLFSTAYAQLTPAFDCGFDLRRNPVQEQAFDEQLRLYFSKKHVADAAEKGAAGLPYVVPVVVHIIHDGGAENISDARVLAAIDHMNEGFAAQGYFAQQGATLNTQIQFCLAKRTPDGQATTGITRTQSPLTNMIMETDDIATKDLNRWNPKDYVNIWVVKEISSLSLGSGVAGYAYLPPAHGLPQDGMICEAAFFGASPAEDAVLIHEMGHYFGLYHTFEGGCPNDDCQTEGDRVCDTPPDRATHTVCNYNSCQTDVAPGSPFATDVNDFTNDFMDYSPFSCYHFFTAGQAVRMQGTVETVRKSLLVSKGCVDPCTQPLHAAFTAAPNPSLAGEAVLFTNNSTGATNYSWSENGTVFSQSLNPSQVFSTLGNHLIVLQVTNGDPNCEDTAQVLIRVDCAIEAGFTVSPLEIVPGTTLTFTNTSTGGATGFEWSVNGFSLATTPDFAYLFSTPGYYSVQLQAGGPVCANAKTVEIHVKSPCGESFFANTRYDGTPDYTSIRDMAGLPDGSSIQCGTYNQQPIVNRLDAAGNVLWHKVMNIDGYFHDIEPLADGTFALACQSDKQAIFARMDADGNLLWFQKFLNQDGVLGAENGINFLAANPDGTFGFYIHEENGYAIVGKMTPAGTVVWMNRYQLLSNTGGLRRAEDGTGDFLLSSVDGVGLARTVFRINQQGNLVKIYRYTLPQQVNVGTTFGFFNVHPDGDFSMAFLNFPAADPTGGIKYMIRCRPDGQPRWAKKIQLAGAVTQLYWVRYLPGEGWLLSDNKYGADHYLIRLDEQGGLMWQRRLGPPAFFGDAVYAAIKHNGLIRAIKYTNGETGFRLLQLPDTYFPINCLPDVPKMDVVTAVPVTKTELTATVTPVAPAFAPMPYTWTNTQLVRTPACPLTLPCAEVCDNEQDDDADGFVDCFDVDCPCFDPDTACQVPAPVNNFAAKLDWQSTVSDASVSSVPIVANLDPQRDSVPEILVIPSSSAISTVNTFKILIFKGDGSNAGNPNTLAIPAGVDGYPAVHPTVADLDRNGVPEVVLVTADGKIRVFTDFDPAANPCMKEWIVSAQTASSGNTRAYAADFDGDGFAELFAGNDVFKLDLTNPAAPALIRILDGNGARGLLGWSNTQPAESSTAADLLSRSDCNGDPDCDGLEIAAGYQIFSIDTDLADGDGYQIKVQRDLNVLDLNHVHTDGYTAVADLNLDGTPEVIVSGRRDNTAGLYVWNKNGLVQNFTGIGLNQIFGMVCVGNVLDDKTAGFTQDFPELIACSNQGIVCLNLQKAQSTPAQPFWWTLATIDASGLTGATIFDFNGDGKAEIVYRDEQNLRIMYGGRAPFPPGVDAQRNWFRVVAGSGTFDEYPVVADVDGDGEAEIAVTSYLFGGNNTPAGDYRGRLRIFESASSPWLPARPLWNQYNYFGVNINDDLTVPKTQQKHWLEMGGIGSGKRPFNTHLAQVPGLKPGTNKIKTPDASLTFESVACKTDSLEVTFRICNFGSAVLPGGTPVAFYLGDPTTTAAPLLFPPVLYPQAVEKGDCIDFQVTIPATYNQTIFAVVNDDGSVPRPFNLATAFPSTDRPECHFDNNLVSFSLSNQTPPLDLGPDRTLCQNSVTELSASPGFQSYRWQDGSTGPDFTAYQPGKYWVDAYDACGFRRTDTVRIILNTVQTLDLPDDVTICAGGTKSLTATGFSGYKWSPAEAVNCPDCASVEIVAQTPVTIYLTAADGDCFVSDSVRIGIGSPPAVQLLAQNGDCDTPASISTSVSGEAPFSFLWSDASTGPNLTASSSGTYTVEVTDGKGCRTVESATVTMNNSLQITAQSTAPACAQTASGAIDLTVSGGSSPLQFLWSNAATTEDLIDAGAGTYTVSVNDANGCTGTFSATLTDPPTIQLSLAKTDPACAGDASGALDLTASGGTGGLQFDWSNNFHTEDLTALAAGMYTVLTTDANGCTATLTATLADPPVLQLSVEKTDPACTGEALGALDLTAAGGTGSLQFDWSGNGTTEDLINLPAGNYTVTTTDANGCTATLSATLADPPAIQLSVAKTDPACAGEASGMLDLTASGGTGGLQFDWSNNFHTEDITALMAGIYTVSATDANGCTAVLSATLTAPPVLQLSLGKTDPLCAGGATGTLDLTASGGTGGLQFEWSNGLHTEDLTGLLAGSYIVVVTDANGCTALLDATLADPPAIQLSVIKTDPLCAGEATGALDLTASGGTGNLQFDWSNSFQTEDVTALAAGIYSVLTTDANGCTASLSGTLTDPPALLLNLQTTNLHCPGDPGSIDLTAGGGTPPLTFAWSGGETTEDITVSQSGSYGVLVADAHGCTKSASVSVSILGSAPVLQLTTDTLTCVKTSGTLTVAADLPGTSFSWSGTGGFSSNSSAPVISAGGLFSVTATEPAGGCTSVGQVWVAVDTVAPVVALAAHLQEIPCDQSTVAISAAGSSGGPGFSIQWTAGPGGVIVSGDQSLTPQVGGGGFYDLLITDLSNGCSAADAVEVVQLTPPEGDVVADSVRCFGETNGAIHVVSTAGGQPPMQYSIDNQNFKADPDFSDLPAGAYTVVVRDANGCEFSTGVEVGQPAPIGVELTGDSLVIRGLTAHLQAIVQPAGLAPAQVDWLPSGMGLVKNQLEQSVQMLENTAFQVRITDERGCSAADTWLVRVDKQHKIYVPNVIAPGSASGANQVFLIYAGGEIVEIEFLQVFDRWGEEVFANRHFLPNEESEGWNGVFRGEPVNAGVFVWVAKVAFPDGTTAVLKGDLTVVR